MTVLHLPTARRRAPYGSQPAVSFDASRPAPHNDALKGAWNDGFYCGERSAYVSGWRWGFVTGLVLALLLAGTAYAAAPALARMGRMLGLL